MEVKLKLERTSSKGKLTPLNFGEYRKQFRISKTAHYSIEKMIKRQTTRLLSMV